MGDSGYLAFEMEMICAATDATLLLMVVLPFQMVGKKDSLFRNLRKHGKTRTITDFFHLLRTCFWYRIDESIGYSIQYVFEHIMQQCCCMWWVRFFCLSHSHLFLLNVWKKMLLLSLFFLHHLWKNQPRHMLRFFWAFISCCDNENT